MSPGLHRRKLHVCNFTQCKVVNVQERQCTLNADARLAIRFATCIGVCRHLHLRCSWMVPTEPEMDDSLLT
eukprot:5226774-Lingulodinium_polyedra.AAC.1